MIFYPTKIYFYPAKTDLFKVNNENTRTSCEICSKTTTTLNVFHADLVLMFPLMTLNKQMLAGYITLACALKVKHHR